MKNIIYLLVFMTSFTAFSQQRYLEITDIKTGKTKIFEENQRVKTRTLDGKKRIGNLKFSDSLSFTINNQVIKTDNIQSIKNNPKLWQQLKPWC